MSGPSRDQTDQALLEQLTEALSGLLWVSETDAPFDVALWEGWNPQELDREESDLKAADQDKFNILPSEAQLLKKAQLPLETPVKQLDLQTFLDPVIHPLYPPESPVVSGQFQLIEDLLQQNLQEIRVYLCGLGEIEIYILGRTPKSRWMVIHTAAVET
jgi:Nuclease A inhibitor-like protein